MQNGPLNAELLDRALALLDARLRQNGASPQGLVVCGGAALIHAGLLPRTTKDVDIIALMKNRRLADPDPLPEELLTAAREVASVIDTDPLWLNNGPSRGEGGLFRMGLPEGLASRLERKEYGSHLTVWYIGRYDQIHFKLYAAADRGGYHITDLQALAPTTDELVAAARWCMTHDVSAAFRGVLVSLLEKTGHAEAAQRL